MPGHGGQGKEDVEVEGTWHENSKFTRGAAGSFHDTDDHFKEEVAPLQWTEESGELETRKLWKLVAKGIREGDFELASREKSRIEVIFIFYTTTTLFLIIKNQNDQRQRRKDEQAAGTTWKSKHFDYEESDPVCKSSLIFFSLYVAKSSVCLRRGAGKINQDISSYRGCLCVQGQLVIRFCGCLFWRRCSAMINGSQFWYILIERQTMMLLAYNELWRWSLVSIVYFRAEIAS